MTGKFSIRSVPDQDPAEITRLVTEHLTTQFALLNSKNQMNVVCDHAGKPWISPYTHWNYAAAASAIKDVYGVEPDYTREGGSIPVTLTFQQALSRNVVLLPMGRADDGAHSINEKFDLVNFTNGIKVLSLYLWNIANVVNIHH